MSEELRLVWNFEIIKIFNLRYANENLSTLGHIGGQLHFSL
jgi:hypothetical protein